jgi:hypothetical protein
MRFIRTERLIIALMAILALLPGATAQGAVAGPKVAISFAGVNPRQTPLWIAHEQGFFAKHGIDADVVFIRTGPIQVAAVSAGQMIIIVDDADRENEGDLIMAAEKVTPEAINFMARYGRGLNRPDLQSREIECAAPNS